MCQPARLLGGPRPGEGLSERGAGTSDRDAEELCAPPETSKRARPPLEGLSGLAEEELGALAGDGDPGTAEELELETLHRGMISEAHPRDLFAVGAEGLAVHHGFVGEGTL